ncbi:MAG TPA: hypothetical protein PK765_01360 [bacterium]|nr:hypothetical protein [bacterium]
MPIVPGMRIEIPSGGRLLIEYFDGARSVFDTPAIYEYQSIGDRDGEYSFALPRENRFSYARLAPFDAGGYGTWANLTLLAPQIAADNEPPVLYVSDTLRIPVYQSREISLRDQISDSSNIAEIFYDFDTTIDTDANGDPTDDRDSLAGDPVFPIRTHTGSNVYDVSLGAFDTLFLRPIRLHAIDAAGNRAFRDVMLEVYAPVPIISGRNASGMVVGGLNESLSGEPVDLVRVRDGYLSRIEPLDGTGSLTNSGTVFTATGGAYAYIPGSGTGAAVWDGDTIIARVDDTTGALRAEPGYRVGIEPKDATNNRMTFTLMPNGSNEILYRQRLELPSGTPLVSVSDFGVVSSDAVYIRVVDPRSRYTHNDAQSPSLPSGAFVVDRDSRAVFGLDATAALVGIRSGVSYEYSELGGYPLVTVVADGVEIAQVWYRLSFDYAVR